MVVEDKVGVIAGWEEQLLIGIFSEFDKSAEEAWEITVPYSLKYDGLKPVTFVVFEIYPPSRAGTLKLWDQSGTIS